MRRRCNDDDHVQGQRGGGGGGPADATGPRMRAAGPTGGSSRSPRSSRSSPAAGCRCGSPPTTAARPGPPDAPFGLELKTPRGTTYLATGRGDLGLARAYIAGDLDIHGVHPGDPYELLKALADEPRIRAAAGAGDGADRALDRRRAPAPDRAAAAGGAAALAPRRRGTPAQQGPRRRGDPPPLRRLEHLLRVGARAVDDVHLRVLSDAGRLARRGAGEQVPAGLREAAAEAGRPAARRRVRLGRHGALRGPPRREGHRRDAVAGADDVGAAGDRRRGARATWPRCASATTATSPRAGFDAVSSIGLLEHIGVRNYPSYFRFLQSRLRPRRAAAQPLHHPLRQHDASRRPADSSTATSSPTASSPARAASSPRRRMSASRCCTRRTCVPTTR